jgi:uncharacterized protein (TIGR02246 family)
MIMNEQQRPKLDLKLEPKPVHAFVRGLQEAIDSGNADLFNLQFADDVLWGSPFGAVAVGYEQIHDIHSRMFSLVKPSPGASQYKVEHVRFPSNNVAIAYVRRLSAGPHESDKQSVGGFDELALFVLVERDGEWWLAAAQHVPDRRDVYLQR